MRSLLISLSIFSLLCAESPAQVCVALPGTGQAPFGIPPPCAGLVPPAVLPAAGNPGFGIYAFAPLAPLAGAPMVLMVGLSAAPFPLPPFLLFPPFGPGSIAIELSSPVISLAGAAGPVPVLVPIPMPPLPPFGMIVTAHTVVLMGGGVAISAGTGVII